MNIKRAFLALSAMLLGVGLFGALPNQAQAAVVTCTATDPAQTQYPYGQWSMRCGSTAVITVAEGQQMSQLVGQLHGQTFDEHKRSNNGNLPDALARPLNGTRFFLFANPQDYADSAASLGLAVETVGNYDFGVTHFDANKVPVYSAVFKTNKAGRTFTNAIRNGTGTQAARGADYLQGFIKNGGILPPVNYRLSDTGLGFRRNFELNLEQDYTVINALLACKNPTTSALGFFSNYSDKDGVFICNGTNGNGTALSATYAGLNNRQALNKAWPHIYTLAPGAIGGAAAGYYAGFFAELYAAKITAGAADTVTTGKTQDAYFNKGFACTIWFANSMPNQGVLTNLNMPVGCIDPTATITTACKKLFVGTGGQFPNGNVFNCTNPSTVMAQQVQQKLDGLGRLGSPAIEVTNIKSEFSRIRTQVFVFKNVAAYNAAFTAAGEPVGGGLTGAVAGTYPNYMWYTIMFGDQVGTSSAIGAYTVTHELAHALDFEPAQQSALADYNTAMQHDWQDLDYRVFPGTPAKACASIAVDGYLGPLVGILDPTTGDATHPEGLLTFCNGNVLRAPWPANAKPSTVLLDSNTFGKLNLPLTYQTPIAGQFGLHVPTIASRLAGWREWHSEAFAIVLRGDVVTNADPLKKVYSQLVDNGYFNCTAGPFASVSWAFNEYSTGAPSSAPAGCLTALPGWTEIKVSP